METCKICNQPIEDAWHFYRKHKVSSCVYYQKYFPRYDRYDGSIILFKDRDYYFNTEFNSKENFVQWLKSISKEEKLTYIKNFLKQRKEKKSLIYAPCQVELRTFMMPGTAYINRNLGGYREICSELGLVHKFNKDNFDKSQFKNIKNKVVFVDSREQKPLSFDNKTRKEAISFGDYRIFGSKIYIERKSMNDFCGTITAGRERFEREIGRAKEAGAYLVILIESSFDSIETDKRIKRPVQSLYHIIRELAQKYEHIQFLFVKNREEASRVIQKIFSVDEQTRMVDLQYLYDIGEL